ncbi:nucleotidyltransferase domain-containing protein [Dyadobacter arcticus]|uniref:Nucleotidyltransferase n=1 Tax=Dyadobacter arcticus TaxID=1078754 RepID=A0ABX0UE34_9BACT|nr:nucleotidyltransferase domain-containing protein [Dyadobacter arcticus]NIJ51257.1 putative nucleotidyltransferase [Dyadobacter arcticus]
MDQNQALTVAQQYVDLLKQTFSVKKAFLFGSFAKGNFHEDSDIDIAIIVENVDDILEAQITMMKLRRRVDIMIEPHPFLEEDFEASNPVAFEVMKYGIEIEGRFAVL